mmetsp:Transcript_629/g.1170  ORF Transcript_629/g.1170 Transcript_629/m.1170 type:complete len:256 (-) Transcript_629:664-1431(-)
MGFPDTDRETKWCVSATTLISVRIPPDFIELKPTSSTSNVLMLGKMAATCSAPRSPSLLLSKSNSRSVCDPHIAFMSESNPLHVILLKERCKASRGRVSLLFLMLAARAFSSVSPISQFANEMIRSVLLVSNIRATETDPDGPIPVPARKSSCTPAGKSSDNVSSGGGISTSRPSSWSILDSPPPMTASAIALTPSGPIRFPVKCSLLMLGPFRITWEIARAPSSPNTFPAKYSVCNDPDEHDEEINAVERARHP